MKELQVSLGSRSYPIYIGNGVLTNGALIADHIRGRRVVIVTSETVAPLYLKRLENALATSSDGLVVDNIILPDGESVKTLVTLDRIVDELLLMEADRDTTLVALGGGVVGDITGFAAATYQRGIDFVQVPTTLLAQVDSSVGGKTAVNHRRGKNMIGSFCQPRCVVIDTDVLQTLDTREVAAGAAEVIKYGLIEDESFLQWLEANATALCAGDVDCLTHAIERSCQIKAQIVSRDEQEKGERAKLNLGHTFGHAIEIHAGYGHWLHGEAVAAGMLLAARMSERLGWLSGADVERTQQVLQAFNLPLEVPSDMSVETFTSHMRKDKKVKEGRIRLVLLESLGSAVVSSDYDDNALLETLRHACR